MDITHNVTAIGEHAMNSDHPVTLEQFEVSDKEEGWLKRKIKGAKPPIEQR
jgi:hypothetical protein